MRTPNLSNIELHHGFYRATLSVPLPLRGIIGKRWLRKFLETANKVEAARRAPAVLAVFHAMLDKARQDATPMQWLSYECPRRPYQPRVRSGRGLARMHAPKRVLKAWHGRARRPQPAHQSPPVRRLVRGAPLAWKSSPKDCSRPPPNSAANPHCFQR